MSLENLSPSPSDRIRRAAAKARKKPPRWRMVNRSGIGESLYYEDREFPSFEEALAEVRKPDFLEYYWHDGSEEWLGRDKENKSDGSRWSFTHMVSHDLKIYLCYTYTPPEESTIGRPGEFFLEMNQSAMGYGEILLHRPNERLLARTRNFGRTFMKFPPFPPFIVSMVSDYEVTIKKQTLLNKDTLPCDKENKINVDSCLLDYFEANNSCSLPWRQSENEANMKLTMGKKVCNSSKEFENLNIFLNSLEFVAEQDIYEVYGLSTVFSQMGTEPLSPYSYYDSNPIFYVAGSSMVHEKEVYIFDFLDLVANIGGYLGLFLGASLLSLYDDTKKMLEYATGRFQA